MYTSRVQVKIEKEPFHVLNFYIPTLLGFDILT